MPSGKVHARVNLALAVPVGVVFGVLTDIPAAAVVASVGCLAGTPITPDLDQEGIGASEWGLIKALGPFGGLGFLWIGAWWFYAWLIPHRSPWSHLPVIGTAGRLVYLLAPALVVCVAAGGAVPPWFLWALPPFAAGLAVADTAHWLWDLIW